MTVQGKARKASYAAACILLLLIVGCTAEDQAALTSSGGPSFALIGFAIDFGRQLFAALLF